MILSGEEDFANIEAIFLGVLVGDRTARDDGVWGRGMGMGKVVGSSDGPKYSTNLQGMLPAGVSIAI